MRAPLSRLEVSLVVLELILGVGALAGGAMLMASPTGALFGMPLSMLEHSPFTSFLVPGLVLFVVNGVVPLGVAVATAKQVRWASFAAPVVGVVLCGWIAVQVAMIRGLSILHFIYFGLGIAILVIGLRVLAARRGARA